MSLGRALFWTDHIAKISQKVSVRCITFIHCFQLRMYRGYLCSSTSIFKSQNKDEKQKHETNRSKLHERASCFQPWFQMTVSTSSKRIAVAPWKLALCREWRAVKHCLPRVASSGQLQSSYHLHGNRSRLGLSCRGSLYTTLNLSDLMGCESVKLSDTWWK